MEIDVFKLIAEDRSVTLYRKAFRPICGGITGVLLFHQIIYWWQKNDRKPFYKFRNACNHPAYKTGDSWCEELGFGERELDYAIESVCEKVKRKDLPEALEKSDKMVLFWTDINRQTWFIFNVKAAERVVMEIYGVSAESAITVIADMGIIKQPFEQLHTSSSASFQTADMGNRNTENTTEITTKTTNKDLKEDGAKKPAPIPVEKIVEEVVQKADSLEAASFEKEKICAKKEKTAPAGFDVFAKQYGDFYEAQTGLSLDLKKAANEKGMLAVFSELKKSSAIKYPTAPEAELPARAAKSLQAITANWGSLSPYLKQQIAPSKLAANLPQIIMAIRSGAGTNGQKQNQPIQLEKPDVAKTAARFNQITI